jgi:gluconate 5-dehydrogenase
MNVDFTGKVAIVTGAGSGIGFACAETLAESGAIVAMIGRSEEKIQKAAQMLADKGNVHPYALDISDVTAIAPVVERIRSELGEISVLIQAAGVMTGGDALELTPAEWDRVQNTNAKGTFFMMQQVVKQSMAQNGGSILNIASMAGLRGMVPPMCSAPYSASKGAVVALTMQAASEWGHLGVRVNAIAPGGTASFDTGVVSAHAGPGGNPPPVQNYVPTGRVMNTPYEIASAAAFLCSALSGNTTGQIMVIDGGASVVGY